MFSEAGTHLHPPSTCNSTPPLVQYLFSGLWAVSQHTSITPVLVFWTLGCVTAHLHYSSTCSLDFGLCQSTPPLLQYLFSGLWAVSRHTSITPVLVFWTLGCITAHLHYSSTCFLGFWMCHSTPPLLQYLFSGLLAVSQHTSIIPIPAFWGISRPSKHLFRRLCDCIPPSFQHFFSARCDTL